jgi:hypothetical protein
VEDKNKPFLESTSRETGTHNTQQEQSRPLNSIEQLVLSKCLLSLSLSLSLGRLLSLLFARNVQALLILFLAEGLPKNRRRERERESMVYDYRSGSVIMKMGEFQICTAQCQLKQTNKQTKSKDDVYVLPVR